MVIGKCNTALYILLFIIIYSEKISNSYENLTNKINNNY